MNVYIYKKSYYKIAANKTQVHNDLLALQKAIMLFV